MFAVRIGRVLIAHPFTLAPLEEHSNYPFRLLMKEFGASLVVSERTDAADVARRERRALRRLYTAPAEAPAPGNSAAPTPIRWRPPRGWSKNSASTSSI